MKLKHIFITKIHAMPKFPWRDSLFLFFAAYNVICQIKHYLGHMDIFFIYFVIHKFTESLIFFMHLLQHLHDHRGVADVDKVDIAQRDCLKTVTSFKRA